MAAPTDPGDFIVGTLADADAVDARFLALYRALDKTVVGLDAASIRDGVIAAAQIETQQAWQTVALAGATWTPTNLSYYKDSIGIVRIRAELFTMTGPTTIPAGTTIATFPAGYRPGATSHFYGRDATQTAFLSMTTAGVLKANQKAIQGGTCTFNIEFVAEN